MGAMKQSRTIRRRCIVSTQDLERHLSSAIDVQIKHKLFPTHNTGGLPNGTIRRRRNKRVLANDESYVSGCLAARAHRHPRNTSSWRSQKPGNRAFETCTTNQELPQFVKGRDRGPLCGVEAMLLPSRNQSWFVSQGSLIVFVGFHHWEQNRLL